MAAQRPQGYAPCPSTFLWHTHRYAGGANQLCCSFELTSYGPSFFAQPCFGASATSAARRSASSTSTSSAVAVPSSATRSARPTSPPTAVCLPPRARLATLDQPLATWASRTSFFLIPCTPLSLTIRTYKHLSCVRALALEAPREGKPAARHWCVRRCTTPLLHFQRLRLLPGHLTPLYRYHTGGGSGGGHGAVHHFIVHPGDRVCWPQRGGPVPPLRVGSRPALAKARDHSLLTSLLLSPSLSSPFFTATSPR